MTATLERYQRLQAVLAIQKATDEASAIRVIADRLDAVLLGLVTNGERLHLYQDLLKLAKQARPEKIRLTNEDIMGAVASCWLVIISTIPAVIPFLFIQQAHLALRISNILLIVLLFLAGWSWAKYTHTNPWYTGFVFMFIGLLLVGIAIALGG